MSIYDLTGNYGTEWRTGILVDHTSEAALAGADCILRVTYTDRAYLSPKAGGMAVPVVCGDLIEVMDSEGMRMDGRCGLRVLASAGACEGHAAEREAWVAMSEIDRRAWESARD